MNFIFLRNVIELGNLVNQIGLTGLNRDRSARPIYVLHRVGSQDGCGHGSKAGLLSIHGQLNFVNLVEIDRHHGVILSLRGVLILTAVCSALRVIFCLSASPGGILLGSWYTCCGCRLLGDIFLAGLGAYLGIQICLDHLSELFLDHDSVLLLERLRSHIAAALQ